MGDAGMAIQLQGVSKSFGAVQAVEDLSVQIAHGTICALLGGNGAGKTTTLSMLLGLLLPSRGEIHVLGEDMVRHRHRVLARMNFSSPYVDLPQRLTVYENLAVYARLYGVRPRRATLQRLGEELDIAAFFPRRYGTLSAGQRTRVALAKSLLNEPEVLLLDEPTASLDPDTADRLRGYLQAYQRRTGAALLLASHNMPEVERICSDVLMMRAGRLVDRGTPQALIARYGRGTLEEVFLDIARYPRAPAEADP
jgi:ABC-2 type transport system ATP-binding protein